jgi:CBS domain-containing protein
MVTGADLKEALVYREAIPLLQVHELQRSDLPTVMPDDTLDVVIDKFAAHDVASLVVVDEQGHGAVLGLITRSRLMQRYQNALSTD